MGWRIQEALAYGPRAAEWAGSDLSGEGAGSSSYRVREDDWVERCDILLPRDLRLDDRILVFRDHPSALGFLRRLAPGSRCLSAFRATLGEVSSFPPPAQLGDVEVLDQLAWLLARGRVLIAVRLGPHPVAGDGAEPAPVSPATTRSAPRPHRAPEPEAVEPPPPVAEVPCNSPACLMAAARDGTPFIASGVT